MECVGTMAVRSCSGGDRLDSSLNTAVGKWEFIAKGWGVISGQEITKRKHSKGKGKFSVTNSRDSC